MPADPIPGRSLVTRRAIRDLVRTAALSVYGVAGLADGGLASRTRRWLRRQPAGLRLELEPDLTVDLHLNIAIGLPVAEVARQVDATVRYALRHGIGREPDRVTIRIEGLRYEPGSAPPASDDPHRAVIGPAELAASGTDVA